MAEHADRQRQKRIRLDEIEDELNANLVQQHELRQQEVRLMEERRQLRAGLLEYGHKAVRQEMSK